MANYAGACTMRLKGTRQVQTGKEKALGDPDSGVPVAKELPRRWC